MLCLNFRGHAILPFKMGITIEGEKEEKTVYVCKIGLYELIFHPDKEEDHNNTFCFIKKINFDKEN